MRRLRPVLSAMAVAVAAAGCGSSASGSSPATSVGAGGSPAQVTVPGVPECSSLVGKQLDAVPVSGCSTRGVAVAGQTFSKCADGRPLWVSDGVWAQVPGVVEAGVPDEKLRSFCAFGR